MYTVFVHALPAQFCVAYSCTVYFTVHSDSLYFASTVHSKYVSVQILNVQYLTYCIVQMLAYRYFNSLKIFPVKRFLIWKLEEEGCILLSFIFQFSYNNYLSTEAICEFL